MFDLSTPLLSRGEWSAAEINAVFRERGNDPGDLGESIIHYGVAQGFNTDILACQIADETAWWTSDDATLRNNPSGFGHTDNAPEGAHFASIGDGIKATVAHWLTYIYGDDNPLSADDPRFDLVPNNHRGMGNIVLELVGNGVWATAPDYAQAIMNRRGEFIDTLTKLGYTNDGGETMLPTQNDIGFPVVINLTGRDGGPRDLSTVTWAVIHDGEGSNDSVVNTLSNNTEASAHAVVAGDGTLTYMVPIDRVAFHAGNLPVNRRAVGIEQEGFADTNKWTYTDEQYRSVAAFIRWCNSQGCQIPAVYVGQKDSDNGPFPDESGIIGHSDVPRDDGKPGFGGDFGHTDPGSGYDFARLVEDITSGQTSVGNGGNPASNGGNGQVDDGVTTVAVGSGAISYRTLTGDDRGVAVTVPGGDGTRGTYLVGHGMYDRWTSGIPANASDDTRFSRAIARDGWPLTDEFGLPWRGTTYTAQVFERAVYIWRDGMDTPDALDLGRDFMHANMSAMPANTWVG